MIGRLLLIVVLLPVWAHQARAAEHAVPFGGQRFSHFQGIFFPPPPMDQEAAERPRRPAVGYAWWLWQPAPTFGPGSMEKGGLSFVTVRGRKTIWQLRLAVEEFTHDPDKLLVEAQEETNVPLRLKIAEPSPGDEDEWMNLSAWTAELFHWYRFLYFVLSFD